MLFYLTLKVIRHKTSLSSDPCAFYDGFFAAALSLRAVYHRCGRLLNGDLLFSSASLRACHVHCHCLMDKHLLFFPCLLYGHVIFAISVCWCGLCLGRLAKDPFRFLPLVVVDSVWLLLVGVLSHPVSLVIVVFSSTVTFPCSLLKCSFKVCKMYQIWQLELLFVRLVKHISKYMLCSIAHNALAMVLKL